MLFTHDLTERSDSAAWKRNKHSRIILLNQVKNLQKEWWRVLFPDLTGRVRSPLRRSISLWGTGYQRKLSFQLKPPYVMSDPAMYSNVSSLITSIIGHTTVFLEDQSEIRKHVNPGQSTNSQHTQGMKHRWQLPARCDAYWTTWQSKKEQLMGLLVPNLTFVFSTCLFVHCEK